MNQHIKPDWLLVVENPTDGEMVLSETLKQLPSPVRIVAANSVLTALSLLHTCLTTQQPLPRLILANLQLPQRQDGFHLLSALKGSASALSQVPLVFNSESNEQDRQEVNHCGGTYLPRPTSPNEWRDFLKTLHYYWLKSEVSQRASNR